MTGAATESKVVKRETETEPSAHSLYSSSFSYPQTSSLSSAVSGDQYWRTKKNCKCRQCFQSNSKWQDFSALEFLFKIPDRSNLPLLFSYNQIVKLNWHLEKYSILLTPSNKWLTMYDIFFQKQPLLHHQSVSNSNLHWMNASSYNRDKQKIKKNNRLFEKDAPK